MIFSKLVFVRLYGSLPLPVQLLLVTQMAFNIGFYLVVPFLATFMTESLAVGGAVVGLVLGLRTFSQQGLFFVGGGLADRFGVRPVLLTGIAIRVLGFMVTGFSQSLVQLMVGVVLIGVAAALFSPAAEAALAAAGQATEKDGTVTRRELFALDTFFSRTGALLGPILGAVLITTGFAVTSVVAAAVFAALFVAHLMFIPAVQTDRHPSLFAGWGVVLRNRRFLLFAAAYSVMLVAYNQQYLSLPVELTRATGDQGSLGWMFVYSGVLILLLQMPVARRVGRMTARFALGLGTAVTAVGFGVLAVAAPMSPPPGLAALVPAVVMLTLLHLGQMIAVPVARDVVARLAEERNLGSYFGVLNTAGGMAVLVSSLLLGGLLDGAETAQASAALPWALLSGVTVVAAVLLVVVCPPRSGGSTSLRSSRR